MIWNQSVFQEVLLLSCLHVCWFSWLVWELVWFGKLVLLFRLFLKVYIEDESEAFLERVLNCVWSIDRRICKHSLDSLTYLIAVGCLRDLYLLLNSSKNKVHVVNNWFVGACSNGLPLGAKVYRDFLCNEEVCLPLLCRSHITFSIGWRVLHFLKIKEYIIAWLGGNRWTMGNSWHGIENS